MISLIASNKILAATVLGSKYKSHSSQTCLSLATNAFRAGDKHLNAGDGHVEKAHSSFSQIHTAKLPATSKQNLYWDHSQVKKSCTILHIYCKFLALLILQAKNCARFLHQLSCQIKILHNSCTFILQHENLATFLHQLFYKIKIFQVSCTRYHTVWVNVNFVSGIAYVSQNTDKRFSSSWSSVEIFISAYSQMLLND